jgi:hypothetical protein
MLNPLLAFDEVVKFPPKLAYIRPWVDYWCPLEDGIQYTEKLKATNKWLTLSSDHFKGFNYVLANYAHHPSPRVALEVEAARQGFDLSENMTKETAATLFYSQKKAIATEIKKSNRIRILNNFMKHWFLLGETRPWRFIFLRIDVYPQALVVSFLIVGKSAKVKQLFLYPVDYKAGLEELLSLDSPDTAFIGFNNRNIDEAVFRRLLYLNKNGQPLVFRDLYKTCSEDLPVNSPVRNATHSKAKGIFIDLIARLNKSRFSQKFRYLKPGCSIEDIAVTYNFSRVFG